MNQETQEKVYESDHCEGQGGKKILNVLYQSSDLYAPMAGVSMVSLMENNKDIDEIYFFLMNDGISEVNLSKFKRACDSYGRHLNVICTKEIVNEIKSEWRVPPHRGSYAAYFKLRAINKLPFSVEQVLYIDADTIVVGSLLPLVDISFDGHLMAAVISCTMDNAKQMLGMLPSDRYFNSGVILFNRKLWELEKCEERIISHVMNLQKAYCIADESILNVLFSNRFMRIDVKYNFASYFYIFGIKQAFTIYGLTPENFYDYLQMAEAYENPVIHHCLGETNGKPWEKNNRHPLNSLFDKHLKDSPWSDYVKNQGKMSTSVSIQRVLHKVLPKCLYAHIHKIALRQLWRYKSKAAQKYRGV